MPWFTIVISQLHTSKLDTQSSNFMYTMTTEACLKLIAT